MLSQNKIPQPTFFNTKTMCTFNFACCQEASTGTLQDTVASHHTRTSRFYGWLCWILDCLVGFMTDHLLSLSNSVMRMTCMCLQCWQSRLIFLQTISITDLW